MAFTTINDTGAIDKAFEDNPPLRKRIHSAIASTPQHATLFKEIADHVSSLKTRAAAHTAIATDGPAPKKRKVANGSALAGTAGYLRHLKEDAELQLYVQDVSFAVPQRKKLRLELTRGETPYLRARNQATQEVEFGVPVGKIEHAICLPIPERTQQQFNFCIIPQYGDGVSSAPAGETAFEPMVFMVPDGPPWTAFHGSGTPVMDSASLVETYQGFLQTSLNGKLKGTQVIQADPKEFVSAMPEAHRKGKKAYHVKAFRGSKEGYLFFLSTGIFFGFKKPLMFFTFENITSISYTSILQRTFNLNIAACPGEQEFEFSMIDQADFAGIDAYVKKHGLQDASLAEKRRAKKLDRPKDEDGANGEEESELQKAQRELEDQEDEEEEDYDPGSDGNSDGSGSSSDEEDYETYNDADMQGRNLVEEELGSEAEEVEVD